MKTNLVHKVRETVAKYQMFRRGELCVVGVSGGPDSMALTHVLWSLKEELGIQLHLAHFNHLLRGAASYEDEKKVVGFAKSLSLALSLKKGEVSEEADRTKGNIEETARELRRAFLKQVAVEVGADKIALGHTANDQVETVLLNLFRGGGPTGLAAMPPVGEGYIVRPLLESWREDIMAYCEEKGLQPAWDESNLDVSYTRNWIRHQLAPLLDERFGSQSWRNNILRTARLCGEVEAVMRDFAQDSLSQMLMETDDGFALDISDWIGCPQEMRKIILREWIRRERGQLKDISAAVIENLDKLSQRTDGYAKLEIQKGLWAERNYSQLRILSKIPETRVGFSPARLSVPGRVIIEELGLGVTAEETNSIAQTMAQTQGKKNEALLDLEISGRELEVRNWRPGDRFQPLGMVGHKKLQDFFVDEKVLKSERDKVPLVTDEQGQILWVAGYRIDERVKIRPQTRLAVHLKVERMSEMRGARR